MEQFSKDVTEQARKLFQTGCVHEIYFSDRTYQVRICDPAFSEDVWTFLQIKDDGGYGDCFCSCQEEQSALRCCHIEASRLKIFNHHQEPLHIRFLKSFWHALCYTALERFGDRKDVLIGKKNLFFCQGEDRQRLFEVRATTKDQIASLLDIMENRSQETEETSLKFSNLSLEDIALWRQGRPKDSLRYELSFWSDLAKWMMQMQEEKMAYKIAFVCPNGQLPSAVTIKFQGLMLFFQLSEKQLHALVPALATVESPLKLEGIADDDLGQITFDESRGVLIMGRKHAKKKSGRKKVEGIFFGPWIYLPGEGFVSKEGKSLLYEPVIPKDEVDAVLTKLGAQLTRFLKGAKAHPEKVRLKYHVYFDAQWNLHLESYVHEKGDLARAESHLFNNWVYLAGDGFYPMEKAPSLFVQKTIEEKQVGEFVSQNRAFLNAQEGFATHLLRLQVALNYTIARDGALCFVSSDADFDLQSHDFGEWIFIKDEGFYAKGKMAVEQDISAGLRVPVEKVAQFIHSHLADLQHIPHFFAPRCPIKSVGVFVKVAGRDSLIIQPHYEYERDVKPENVYFYDFYVYEKGKGFTQLVIDQRLPAKFRHERKIDKEHVPAFIEKEMPQLQEFLAKRDHCFMMPQNLQLEIHSLEMGHSGRIILQACYVSKWGRVGIKEILEEINKRCLYAFTPAGFLQLQHPRFGWLHQSHHQLNGGALEMSIADFLRLSAKENIKENEGMKERSVSLLHSLLQQTALQPPPVSKLSLSLRPYQEVGLSWLWYLYTYSLSGLLCDDMGLGKTHQAMALMAAITSQNAARKWLFVIVCPISVIYHWQDKLRQYLPSVVVTTYHGIKRSLSDYSQAAGVLLTSYGVLRSEVNALQDLVFDLAIFDEIQIAKNHLSKTYRALKSIKAGMRLGLTGTPIENHIGELKALFDLILPGYFPSDASFKSQFVNPIEKDNDQESKQALVRLIRPFVLRRKKKEVLHDLPEKVEEIAHCDLSDDQQKLYHNTLYQARKTVLATLQDETQAVPYLPLFQLLTQLKQICDHPAVALKDFANWHQYSSGKWQLFLELLQEAMESEQKVVVFSHYLLMLDIIEDHLKKSGIRFASVRGQTVKRAEEFRRFQNDPQCAVFVASLHAVGMGVDLTAASVVIHYDRWWNAAKENQATDRVHRIGQTRGVQVFKLLTRHTIEERIDELIFAKGELLEEVVMSDDPQDLKRLSRKDLLAIFHGPAAEGRSL